MSSTLPESASSASQRALAEAKRREGSRERHRSMTAARRASVPGAASARGRAPREAVSRASSATGTPAKGGSPAASS